MTIRFSRKILLATATSFAAIKPVHDSLAVILSGGGVVPFDADLWAHYASGSSAETVRFYEQR
jgi:hypothetical protein